MVTPATTPVDTHTGSAYRRSTRCALSCRRKVQEPQTSVASRIASRDALITEHLPLVRSIAKGLRDTLPASLDFDDLVHAGVIGLIDAASKFDAGRDVSFAIYARHRIRGAIVDSLREMDWASRDLRRKDKQIQRVTRDLSSELERSPTVCELADRMGVDVAQCRKVLSHLQSCSMISADTAGPQDSLVLDFEGSRNSRPDCVFGSRERQTVIARAMNELPQRHREVLTLYYGGEYTMKEIGGELGINESRVSQIHKVALTKMESALDAIGVRSSGDFLA